MIANFQSQPASHEKLDCKASLDIPRRKNVQVTLNKGPIIKRINSTPKSLIMALHVTLLIMTP